MKQIIKAKFMRHGAAYGRPYSYYAEPDIKTGEIVYLPLSAYSNPEDGHSKGLVIQTNVPASEVADFADQMKSIVGRVEAVNEDV